ncbi:hypothetical protein BGZ83_001228 [Gryganskiella cystojenkinii]|nr:hypothetical protein BGZ83_001228 [Gryganskiella cystojenkinii]
MFLSGGPGRVLSEVLTRGGDPRALFTIRDHVPPEIAIAKAVETGDKMLDTIIAIWGTNVSDGGLQLAMKTGMSYGTRKLPGDVVVEISSMGLGSSLGLLAEGLTKEQIMRTRHWPGVELRNLFTHGFTREVPMYLIKATIGTIVKEGMEEDLLGYLERNPFTFDADDVPEFINSLGYEKVLTV